MLELSVISKQQPPVRISDVATESGIRFLVSRGPVSVKGILNIVHLWYPNHDIKVLREEILRAIGVLEREGSVKVTGGRNDLCMMTIRSSN